MITTGTAPPPASLAQAEKVKEQVNTKTGSPQL